MKSYDAKEIYSSSYTSPTKAAYVMGVTRALVHQMVASGQLKAHKDGEFWQVDVAHLKEVVLKRRVRLLKELNKIKAPTL